VSDPLGDLRRALGDDVPEPELERLRHADELLRQTPPPPEVPESLTAAVLAVPGRRSVQRRRLAAGLAFAAVVAGAAFGIGFWAGGDSDELPVADRITLNATADAPRNAWMSIDILPIDKAGNWPMLADVGGLPPLPEGGYYEIWMTKDGELAASCGRFVVDAHGDAQDVWLNAPYELKEYDRWVVAAVLPGQGPSPWLLDGPVTAPV
jgi:hypothetical protein